MWWWRNWETDMDLRSGVAHLFRNVIGERNVVVVTEGNAFHDSTVLMGALSRCTLEERQAFEEGVIEGERYCNLSHLDPYTALEAGRLQYTQAAVAFLTCIAYKHAQDQGLLDRLDAHAGYSFGGYPLLMMGVGAPIDLTVFGGFVRADAQIRSVHEIQIEEPFNHLFTVPNNKSTDTSLRELYKKHPHVFHPAILACTTIAISSRQNLDQFDLSGVTGLKYKPGHPPYHDTVAMAKAPELFKKWFIEKVVPYCSFDRIPETPIWIGRPRFFMEEARTFGQQVCAVVEDIAQPVSWIEIVHHLHNKQVVSLTVGENVRMSPLQILSGIRNAPGHWTTVSV
jgi:hypothetical protein